MIAIVDLGVGNFANVRKALDGELTEDPEQILKADKVVLPGVGKFGPAARRLEGLRGSILSSINKGKPFLGICLGMQLLFEKSEEEEGEGLGVFPGKATGFPDKSPHIGWNRVEIKRKNRLFRNLKGRPYFYFVHSYYLEDTEDTPSLAVTEQKTEEGSVTFSSAVGRENVFGTQFHPEKSGENGKRLLRNFKNL